MAESDSGWEDYDSGPFCRHWCDPVDCDAVCAVCGHRCLDHGFGDGAEWSCNVTGCACAQWQDVDKGGGRPMPTDTTIIDRLRGLAEMMGSDGEAEAEASAIMLAAADALTAAHAAAERERDALRAQATATGHVPYLDRMRELAEQLTTALRERDELQERLNDIENERQFSDFR